MLEIIATTAEAVPSAGVIIASLVAGMTTGITAVWTWFRGELNECKADRKDLFAHIEDMHKQIADLSMRVGNVERKP